MRKNDPFGACAYCGNRILWIRTLAGKNMPCDPQLVGYRKPKGGEKAEERIVTGNGEVIVAIRVPSNEAEGNGYISHFATCPGYRKR